MMINSASHPFCNQPAIGGPVYWIRNIAYHAPGGSTRMTNGAAGVLFYNNTILTETAAGFVREYALRNNSDAGREFPPAIFSVNTYTNYSSSDYNGFRPNPGAAFSFSMELAARHTQADYSGMLLVSPQPAAGRVAGNPALEERRFNSLAEYTRAVRQDTHSVILDYDVFMNVPRLDAQDVKTFRSFTTPPIWTSGSGLGSAAIDRGVVASQCYGRLRWNAPDLGALEAGQAPPHMGPDRKTRRERESQGDQPPMASRMFPTSS